MNNKTRNILIFVLVTFSVGLFLNPYYHEWIAASGLRADELKIHAEQKRIEMILTVFNHDASLALQYINVCAQARQSC